ncbi:MAG: hypothetical protein WD176_03670, partial [Pirellulales bacterium]
PHALLDTAVPDRLTSEDRSTLARSAAVSPFQGCRRFGMSLTQGVAGVALGWHIAALSGLKPMFIARLAQLQNA